MRELPADDVGEGFIVCGGVPQDWRLRRRLATLHASEPLPFLDVDAPETQAFLSEELAGTLIALGYADNLDIS